MIDCGGVGDDLPVGAVHLGPADRNPPTERGVDPLPPEYPAATRVHADLPAFVDFLLAREARHAADVAAQQAAER